jgi:branched-chain amino acid transport system ATP-binding protein
VLRLSNVEVLYDRSILVLRGVSFEVPQGGIVALLGSNGAGKSTTLKAISGILGPERGAVTTGSIEFQGPDGSIRIDRREPEEIVHLGIAQVMEGRRVFEHLTAEENLLAGAHTRRDKGEIRRDLRRVYEYFPRLADRRRATAGYLSGGEQQMLAIGRALMSRPRMMLLDEPSLGLAPLLVEEIFRIIRRLNEEEGVTVLLVEQNAAMALTIARHGYIMENGRIVLDGPAEVLRHNEDIKEFYLGLSEVGVRRSYRDVKHYRRRKRWLA